MIKLFSYNNPVSYLLLLLFVVVLRAPAFHHQFFNTDESIYMISAERIADGGMQYVDTSENKPPLLIWFYSLFAWIFGAGALLAIRIFTCLYVFITAVIFNQIILNYRFLQSFSVLPAFLFIVLACTPWYSLEMNGELLLILPLLVSVYLLIESFAENKTQLSFLFIAGLLAGVGCLIKYQAGLHFLCLIICYRLITPWKWDEVLSLTGGFLLIVLTVFLWMYFRGNLPAFWEIGVLYNIDYLRVGVNPGEVRTWSAGLKEILKHYGLFLMLGVVGFILFRISYFNLSIRQRKVEAVMSIWLLTSILGVLAGGSRLYLHYFIMMVPPVLFYVTRFFQNNLRFFLRDFILLASLVFPLIIWISFIFISDDSRFESIRGRVKQNGWAVQTNQTFRKSSFEESFQKVLEQFPPKEGILVLEFTPEMYLRLKQRCASRYTNFSVAYYKISVWKHKYGHYLVSGPEDLSHVYTSFENEKPDYVVDPSDLFGQLKEKLPLLLHPYQKRNIGGTNVYVLDRSAIYPVFWDNL